MDVRRPPACELGSAVQEDLEEAHEAGVVELDAGDARTTGDDGPRRRPEIFRQRPRSDQSAASLLPQPSRVLSEFRVPPLGRDWARTLTVINSGYCPNLAII